MSTSEKKPIGRQLLVINVLLMMAILTILILLFIDRTHIGYVDEDKIIKKYSKIKSEKSFKMFEPVNEMVATEGVDAFRDEHNYGSYFVTYDTSVINDFIDSVTTQIQNSGRQLGPDSCWQVGFYPYIKDADPGSSVDLKVDFLAVPVIVPKRSTSANYRDWGRKGDGCDYFAKSNNQYNKAFIKPYDFGNMHP